MSEEKYKLIALGAGWRTVCGGAKGGAVRRSQKTGCAGETNEEL